MTQHFSITERDTPVLSLITDRLAGLILSALVDFKMVGRGYILSILFEVKTQDGSRIYIEPGSISGMELIDPKYELSSIEAIACFFPTREEYQNYIDRHKGI